MIKQTSNCSSSKGSHISHRDLKIRNYGSLLHSLIKILYFFSIICILFSSSATFSTTLTFYRTLQCRRHVVTPKASGIELQHKRELKKTFSLQQIQSTTDKFNSWIKNKQRPDKQVKWNFQKITKGHLASRYLVQRQQINESVRWCVYSESNTTLPGNRFTSVFIILRPLLRRPLVASEEIHAGVRV